VKSQCKRKLR